MTLVESAPRIESKVDKVGGPKNPTESRIRTFTDIVAGAPSDTAAARAVRSAIVVSGLIPPTFLSENEDIHTHQIGEKRRVPLSNGARLLIDASTGKGAVQIPKDGSTKNGGLKRTTYETYLLKDAAVVTIGVNGSTEVLIVPPAKEKLGLRGSEGVEITVVKLTAKEAKVETHTLPSRVADPNNRERLTEVELRALKQRDTVVSKQRQAREQA